jgi:mono/diheme cytochrome c family protein
MLALAIAVGTVRAEPGDARVRGEYLFRIAGCAACHTDLKNGGAFLAGGRAFETPFGKFFAPNITPDPTHGIGGWSDGDFLRALKAGIAPDGSSYFPAFPYTAYAGMDSADALAIKAYLDTVPAVAQPDRPHELPWYLGRIAARVWKWLYFRPPEAARPAPDRGAYLAEAVAHCGECHTPRDALGGLVAERSFAGTASGPEGKAIPNITPDRRTGIGKWSRRDVAEYLRTGAQPDGDYAGSLMAEVIDEGLQHLTPEDALAIADHVLGMPALENEIRRQPKSAGKKRKGEFD